MSALRPFLLIWLVSAVLGVGSALLWANAAGALGLASWSDAPVTESARSAASLWSYTLAVLLPFLYGTIGSLAFAIFGPRGAAANASASTGGSWRIEAGISLVPAAALLALALPAYPVLRAMDQMPSEPDVVISVTGHQFFWQYDFPREGVTLIDDGTGEFPLLVPVGKTVLLTGTATQVNHAWWVPRFGVKFDVLPGRLTQAWFRAEETGRFRGQCAELCGALHAQMIIHVEVVTEEEFRSWLAARQAGGEA